jgi:hypothetical protein
MKQRSRSHCGVWVAFLLLEREFMPWGFSLSTWHTASNPPIPLCDAPTATEKAEDTDEPEDTEETEESEEVGVFFARFVKEVGKTQNAIFPI